MPLLPLGSFTLMQEHLVRLHNALEKLKNVIPPDDLKKMFEDIEAVNQEIRGARF